MSQPEDMLPGSPGAGGGSIEAAGVVGSGGAPLSAPVPGGLGEGGVSIAEPDRPVTGFSPIGAPEIFSGGEPIGGPANIFNIHGAPIAVLGGVFERGLPIGGPVSQVFRGGSAPVPNTLFIATISPSGPIGGFFVGSSGSPIGSATFGSGGLPIGGEAGAGTGGAAIGEPSGGAAAGAPLIRPRGDEGF